MPRLQILELPEGADDDRPPFALVIDQADEALIGSLLCTKREDPDFDLASRIGARTVLVFEETMEIPANDLPVDEHGLPLTIHIEADTTVFHEQVEAAARWAADRLRTHPQL
ncbi:hypothetical protein HHL19_16570 [Streptomyces sp. R302]|uniref:hypothetical protein n=1 Tax=unclassified Streptomyces TaxID=2593676 RepID=UPI00145F5BC2|nr:MULTISPECIES: hypothetical protein [unclassified Streptomyces]NML55384.1 hypothetical protein [Streptomyces sp. R301]NML80256.1 hypothetical protein [Streptomyces sp. R302]